MELQDALAAAKAELESPKSQSALPSHALERLRQLTLELVVSGRAGKAKHAGEIAPSFRLPAVDGAPLGILDLADAPLVVVFVAGGWCPYCTLELAAFERFRPVVERLGARLVAISADTVEGNRRTSDEIHLNFPLLSDGEGRVSNAFGLRYDLPTDIANIYRDHFGAVFAQKGRPDRFRLPMHGRYVIDRGGQIVFSEVDPDYARRSEPTELVPVLEHLYRRNLGRRSC